MNVTEFLAMKATEPDKASDYGHTFISMFNQNKYHWFLKYVMGFESTHKAPALLFGGVLHSVLEAWFTVEGAKNGQSLKLLFNELMKQKQTKYKDQDKFREDCEKGLPMLMQWANTWAASDNATYDVLECERVHEVPLANGFTVTIKPDVVLSEKETGHVVILEHKSTSFSVNGMYQSVVEQDQATMYEWAITKDYPERTILGVLPDILYKKGNVCKAERPGYISRGPYALWRLECQLIGLYQDMASRLEALQRGVPYEFLFPRNGKDTAYFSDEYGVLDWDKPDPRFVPEGFTCRKDAAKEFLKGFLVKWNACEKIDWSSWTATMKGAK